MSEKLMGTGDGLSRIDEIMLQYALKLKEFAEVKKQISEYISKYDKKTNYDPLYQVYTGSHNQLLEVYTKMYDVRKDCRKDCELGMSYEEYSILNFYELVESKDISYSEVEGLHNLFVKKRQLKKKLGYSKGQITKYAKKLLEAQHKTT